MRSVAISAALLGGVCWVLGLFVTSDALRLSGAIALGAAVLIAGGSLVRVGWLRVVVGLGALALAGSLVELARDHADDATTEAVVGGLATLAVAVTLLRGGRREHAAGHAGNRVGHAGNH